MQNKGYEHPFGSTVIPNAPRVSGNGIPEGQGPSGAPSAIPGTIGVAGPRARDVGQHFKVAGTNRCACGQWWPHDAASNEARTWAGIPPREGAAYMAPEQPRSMVEAMGLGALDGLINLLADRLAPRIAELVTAQVIAKIGELGAQAIDASPELEKALTMRPAPSGLQSLEKLVVQSPPMVAGSAAGVHDFVGAGIEAAATNAVGISPEQIKAYSKAHAELLEAVMFYGVATVGEASLGFEVLRPAPEPPVFALTAKNGATSTWTAYSAAYDQPRFRLATPPGVLPADRYLVVVDGTKLDYMMVPQLLATMAQWLVDNSQEIQRHGRDESGSFRNAID